jgi:multidrug efflux pump
MTLSELSIRRPVLAVVISILIVVFGVLGFQRLPVREYPAQDPPIVTVSTTYAGASPEIMDSQVTEVLEQAVNGIPGIRTISSSSGIGRSVIRIEFTLETDMEAAANDVRDKVAVAVGRLPADVNPPVVEKVDADSDPIIFLTLRSDRRSILEVSNAADTIVKERVQTIPGVSAVRIFGEQRFAMRLWLDPDRMTAHRVTPGDVQEALRRQNVVLPSGRIEGSTNEVLLQTEGRLSTVEDFQGLIIRRENGRAITLADVGYAELSSENLRTSIMNEGLRQIGVAVIPQGNANAIAIADEFYRRLDQIRAELPSDYILDLGFDFTRFVRRSVQEVKETLALAFILVAMVIFLFLRDWRSTLIPVITIPVSLISAFFIMSIMGFSINILTLVAMVLAVGLVCDDAIVVLENIYTKIEEGMTPLEAALKGSREIYFAVLSTTVSLAAVFTPILFLEGLTGRLFREFGVVIAGSVLVSSLVALTLSPMMSRYMLKNRARKPWLQRVTEPFFEGLTGGYRRILSVALRLRYLAIPLLMVSVAGSTYLARNLRAELAPLEDRYQVRAITRAPEGTTFEYVRDQMDRLALMISDKYGNELSRLFAISGWQGTPNIGNLIMYFKEPEERSKPLTEIFADISADLQQFPGLRAFPAMPPTIGSRQAGQPVQFVLQATSLAQMNEVLPRFLAAAQQRPELRFVDSDLKINRPQVDIAIDRDRSAELGVSVLSVADTLRLGLGEARFGYFLKNGRQYEVIGALQRDDRNDPEDLRRLHVRSESGLMIPLDTLTTRSETVSPSAIFRFNRYISATVSAGLAPGFTLGDGLKAMQEVAAEVLPENFPTSLAGQSRDFAEASGSLLFAFVLAIVLIYLVLAAQFDSFIHPFTILLTVPLSVGGAMLTLWWFGQTLNVFSQIGIIMLIGLVTKNGILIVEFANQRREAGLELFDAVLEAAVARFRPILMTSISTILGILPIAMAIGGSAASRQSMGIGVIGGMILSTMLTLIIIPCMYLILTPKSEKAAAAEKARDLVEASDSEVLGNPVVRSN